MWSVSLSLAPNSTYKLHSTYKNSENRKMFKLYESELDQLSTTAPISSIYELVWKYFFELGWLSPATTKKITRYTFACRKFSIFHAPFFLSWLFCYFWTSKYILLVQFMNYSTTLDENDQFYLCIFMNSVY